MTPARRSVTRTLPLLLAALLVLAACTGSEPGEPAPTGGDRGGDQGSEQRGPTGAVPEGLDRFYGQQISWQGCADYATTDYDGDLFADDELECARVEVPLVYDEPDGETASIGVLRRPADEQGGERIGSLLVNPGGPGGSGMSAAASMAGSVAGTDLGARFDLVGFDPRGIAASEPRLTCRTTEEMDAERLDNDADTSPAGIAETEDEERAYAEQCSERVGDDVLENAGTRDVARDMDVLRSVLGDEQLSYVGYSYGTRIGTEYAEQFPRNVRALVLDGAVDPDEDPVESLVNQGAGFQQSFDAFVDWCLEQQECWLGDTPREQANARFQELVRPLIATPLPVQDRALSYGDATTGAITALYSDQSWPLLQQGLAGLQGGDGTVLLTLADLYFDREDDGYSGSEDAFTAIRCVDDPPVADPAVVREADRRYREVAPFLDDGNPPSGARDACAFWPVRPTGEPGVPEVEGLPEVVVISTTGDPATPYAAGEELARQLGARLFTFEGNQHTVFLQDVACVDDPVSAYLIDLTLPEQGARCGGS